MKKENPNRRDRIKILNERKRLCKKLGHSQAQKYITPNQNVHIWLNDHLLEDQDFSIADNGEVSLILPENMDFSENYERTAVFVNAIRIIAKAASRRSVGCSYTLRNVSFDKIRTISTSAGLVLAAEISRWNDTLPGSLTPRVEGWDPKIRLQLTELGFFELFKLPRPNVALENTDIRHIKYLKGSYGEENKTVKLRKNIESLIGDTLHGSPFLFQGLSEAINNVCEHAYPHGRSRKRWYVTGGYKIPSNELKIVFYDQGVGIPHSMPTSNSWNKVSQPLIARGVIADHGEIIRAAVEMGKTSSLKEKKGKGLQDLHEFIRQRDFGYLAIFSQKGLYKYEKNEERIKIKTVNFKRPIQGTLIIWTIQLGEKS